MRWVEVLVTTPFPPPHSALQPLIHQVNAKILHFVQDDTTKDDETNNVIESTSFLLLRSSIPCYTTLALEYSRDTITHALGQTLLRARNGLGGSQNQAEA